MTNLQPRLKKLGASRTDSSGSVPHSPTWFEHWYKQLDLYTVGELQVLSAVEIIVTQHVGGILALG